MSNIENIRQEIAQLKGVKLYTFSDILSEEPDKSLEEEVKRYYSDNFAYISSDQPTLSILTNIARHFAKWQKEQMLKYAVEKTVGQLERQWGGNIHFMHGFEVDEMDFPFLNSQECGYGDKVRIIVCKKED